MNETLMRIVATCACFFETADESVLDSGTALQCLEEMKWELQKLSQAEKAEMARFISSFAQESHGAARTGGWQRCLEYLPRALGLVDAAESGDM